MFKMPAQFWYGVLYVMIALAIAIGMFVQHGLLLGSLTALVLFNQGSILMSQVKANAVAELMAAVARKRAGAAGVDHQAATGRAPM